MASEASLGPPGAAAGVAEPGLAERYRRSVAFRAGIIVLLFVLALAAALADLAVGSGTLSLSQVLATILHPSTADPTDFAVVWQIRAPMTAIALITGCGLALSGLLMQTVLNNPLADPFTLGVSSAAGFGAAIAIVFQASVLGVLGSWLPPELSVALNAFVFSLGTVLLVSLLAARGGLGLETVTLLGIAVHFTFSALLAFAQYVADPSQLQSLIFWLLGSLLRATWLKVEINGGLLLLVLPLVLFQAWALTALRAFGDQAVVLGVRVVRLRLLALTAAALLAGAATATIGVVGFIGLVAPHIARLMVGEDQRFALPATAACGALILTLASLASKLILPGAVLPIGMVTALLGVPFFLAQILSRRGGKARA
ncbi:MAG TPA: iron ABC transporter permease [Devosiaceae bacterium]|nr:iron ABC transporter permease [Devosiaceae bacterium]